MITRREGLWLPSGDRRGQRPPLGLRTAVVLTSPPERALRRRPGWRVSVSVFGMAFALLFFTEPAAGDEVTISRQDAAKRMLEQPGLKKPYPCHDAWLATEPGHILDLEAWAEASGLRRGDRIVSLGGVSVAETGGWSEALQRVNTGKIMRVRVERGGRLVDSTLACKDNTQLWQAQRAIYETTANGDWDACWKAAGDAMKRVGRPYSIFLQAQLACWDEKLKAASAGQTRKWNWWDRFGRKKPHVDRPQAYWRLLYRLRTQELQEMRFSPVGVTAVRHRILAAVENLREAGMEVYAEDLRQQLYTVPTR